MDAVVILITAASEIEAQKISEILIEKRLAACVSVVPRVNSIFHWQGHVSKETETLLLVKSLRSKMDEIISTVKSNHSYQVPEIIALPVVEGSADYLNWIREEVSP